MHVNAIARLQRRRRNVLMTLEHLQHQQNEVDANTEWKDLCAQRRRTELLAELLGWYKSKLRRIDYVLGVASTCGESDLPPALS
jgi:orotate phosphoribosyltransferase-like protein